MSVPRTYWIGGLFTAEWSLTDLAGVPIVDATVTGQVSLPGGGTAPMVVTGGTGGVYTATYTPAVAGTHGFTLTAAGTATDVYEDTFTVAAHRFGALPITVDPATDVGMVRTLATDLNEVSPLFSDAQIEGFLAVEGGGVKRAAALALETIAVSEALVSKKIRTSDGLSTDGPAVAAELRARATSLREQASTELDVDNSFGLEIVDFDPLAAYRAW